MKDNACMYVSTPRIGFPSLLSKRSLENCSPVLHPGIVETFCTMLTRSDNLYPETRLSSLSLSLSLSLILSLLLLLLSYKIIRGPRNLIQASPQYSDVSPKLIHRVRSITDGIKLYFDQGHNIHCGWTENYWSDFLVRGRICEIGTIFNTWWH